MLKQRMDLYLQERVPTVAEQVHLHMITRRSPEEARKVKSRVEAGEDFATVSVITTSGTTVIATSGTELPNSTVGFEGVTLDLTPFVGGLVQVAFRLRRALCRWRLV